LGKKSLRGAIYPARKAGLIKSRLKFPKELNRHYGVALTDAATFILDARGAEWFISPSPSAFDGPTAIRSVADQLSAHEISRSP
jgi:hypothetical protein